MTPPVPKPPFNQASALQKVRAAEDLWNTKDPAKVARAYTEDTYWRNRSAFLNGRDQVVDFLTRKWQIERDYRLIKELWLYGDDRIAVRFAYEWHDDTGQWYRSYGNENWAFDERGLMHTRLASINDLAIDEADRLFRWPAGPRPDAYASLSELGL